MCVIAIYDSITRPTLADVTSMIKANPDGVGVAYNNGRYVSFVKGLKNAVQVLAVYEEALERGGLKNFVFHARIATSGGVSASKCHPFIVSPDDATLNKTQGIGDITLLFHNGIFPVDIDTGLSDTQSFVKNYLYPLYKSDKKGVKRGKYSKLIQLATRGNRVVIMDKDCVQIFGAWEERKGVYYSNLNHLWRERSVTEWSLNDGFRRSTVPVATGWGKEWEV